MKYAVVLLAFLFACLLLFKSMLTEARPQPVVENAEKAASTY